MKTLRALFALLLIASACAFAQDSSPVYNFKAKGDISVPFLVGTTAPSSGTCDAADEAGSVYLRTGDPSSVPQGSYVCRQTGASSWAWQQIGVLSGLTVPATCVVGGPLFFDTDASPGSNLFGCTATDTWTVLGTGGLTLGTGVQTFLGTASSSNLRAAMTDETGTSGGLVFANGSTLSNNTYSGTQDASGATSTKPIKTGTSLPATCGVGEAYLKTDATAGSNFYTCLTTNTWTQQAGSGGGGGVSDGAKGDVTISGGGTVYTVNTLPSSRVGLGNVDNTSDSTKNSAVATLLNKTLTTPIITSYTIATRPAASAANRVVIITDALTTGDCTTGGGTARALCRDTGSAWESLGDGGSGGGGGSGDVTGVTCSVNMSCTSTTGPVPNIDIDTGRVQTRPQAQTFADHIVTITSASGTTWTGTMLPAPGSYSDGMVIEFPPNATCSGTPTLAIGILAAKNMYEDDGTTAATCTSGKRFLMYYDPALNSAAGGWRKFPGGTGGGSSLSLASQAEAQAGTDNTKAMTPLRTLDAINANRPTITSWTNHPQQPASFTGANVLTGNLIGLQKVWIREPITATTLTIHFTTAAGGACAFNAGLYSVASSPALLYGGGSTTINCSSGQTTGVALTIPMAATIPAGEYYLATTASAASAGFGGFASNGAYELLQNNGQSFPSFARGGSWSGSGALPATLTLTAATDLSPITVQIH